MRSLSIVIIFIAILTGLYFWYVRGVDFLPQKKSQPSTKVLNTNVAPQGTWIARKEIPTPRTEVGVAALEDRIYAIGGFNGFARATNLAEVYFAQGDSWATISPLPEEIHHAAVAAADGMLYVIGGLKGIAMIPSDKVYAYDPKANTWTEKPKLLAARGAAAVGVINDKIYFAGGQGAGTNSNELFIFDPKENRWQEKAPMNVTRDHLCGGAVGEKFYTVGGRKASLTANLATLEVYDPATDSWSLGPDLPTPRGGIACAVLSGKLYVFGGEASTKTFDATEVFDPKTNTWSRVQSMPTSRHGLGAAVVDNKIYVLAGGKRPGLSVTGTNEVFTPAQP